MERKIFDRETLDGWRWVPFAKNFRHELIKIFHFQEGLVGQLFSAQGIVHVLNFASQTILNLWVDCKLMCSKSESRACRVES